MYGMTPMGAFFTAIFPLKINEHALCQQLQFVPKSRGGRLRRRALCIPSVLTQFRIKKALAPVVGANAFCFSQPLTEMDQQFSYCPPGSRVIRSGCSSNTATLSCSEGSETHGSMQT